MAMFPPGAPVEYNSTSHGGWVPAIVHGFNEQLGVYILDVQPNAHPSKVRAAPGSVPGLPGFAPPTAKPNRLAIGTTVEYFSASFGGWVPGVVQGFNEASGTYMLNVHPAAPPEKVRELGSAAPAAEEASAPEGLLPPMHSIRRVLAVPMSVLGPRPAGGYSGGGAPPALTLASGVFCPVGHVMTAKVGREMLQVIKRNKFTMFSCDQCTQPIDLKEDALYECKDCDINICVQCASSSTPGAKSCPGSVIERVMPGDIFYFGPDQFSIHHTVLARSRISRAPSSWFDAPPVIEFFQCHTIESTGSERGEITPWYNTLSFFQRAPDTGRLMLVADMPPGPQQVMNLFEEPVPIKVLLHPLRHKLDKFIFNEAVLWGASTANTYGKKTAVRAFLAQAVRFGHAQILEPANFPSPESRAKLLEKLRAAWADRPICASVCIKVWQMYFEVMSREAGQPDVAVREILQYMPVLSNVTTPSALLKALTGCGWELHNL